MPGSSEELNELLQEIRKNNVAQADMMAWIAGRLAVRLATAQPAAGRTFLLGLDRKIAARRIARRMQRAADAATIVATEAAAVWRLYEELFIAPQGPPGGNTWKV